MFNTRPWLYYDSPFTNKFVNTYIQGFLDICGNIVLRNGGFSLPNGDVSMNGNLYVGLDTTMGGNVNIQGNLLVNKRVLQTLSNDPSYNSVNGYYALAENVQPIVSKQTAYDIGQNWQTIITNNSWSSVCWSPELGLFCAVSNGGTGNFASVSNNGTIWNNSTNILPNPWSSVCWSPKLGLFCVVANGDGYGMFSVYVMLSSDGIIWNAASNVPSYNYTSVCWSNELNLFLAVASNGYYITSYNGYNWIANGQLSTNLTSVCWSPELGLFCTVSSRLAAVSKDGINFTSKVITGANFTGICWSPELGLFCATAYAFNPPKVMISTDGLNWQNKTVYGPATLTSICWSSELGLFVASGYYYIAISKDGLNWNVISNPNDIFSSVCWSPELSMFCMTGTGSGYIIITNPDYRVPTTKSIKTLLNDGNYNINIASTPSGTFPNFRTIATGPNLISIGNGNYKLVADTLRDSIAIGNTILNAPNPNGYGMIGMGQNVFPALTTGFQNIGIGNAIATSMTTGYNNVFIGNSVATSTTSTGNTVAIGTNAGRTNTTGINNTYLGAFTDANATGYNNSTALGFGATITSSNQIKLGTAAENVDISGNLNVTGLTSLFGYFTTNVIGLSYIRGAASNASITAGNIMQIGNIAGYDTMLFNTVGTSLSGSVFTAPITGYYFIYASAFIVSTSPGFAIRLNATSSTTGTEIGGNYTLASSAGLTASSTLIRRLTAGETISFYSKGCTIFSRATGLSGSNCIIYLLFAN